MKQHNKVMKIEIRKGKKKKIEKRVEKNMKQ